MKRGLATPAPICPVWDLSAAMPEGRQEEALKKDITHLYGRITGRCMPEVPV